MFNGLPIINENELTNSRALTRYRYLRTFLYEESIKKVKYIRKFSFYPGQADMPFDMLANAFGLKSGVSYSRYKQFCLGKTKSK